MSFAIPRERESNSLSLQLPRHPCDDFKETRSDEMTTFAKASSYLSRDKGPV